jgi:methylmalonyl-CoA mutase N-terminal domain/subunit
MSKSPESPQSNETAGTYPFRRGIHPNMYQDRLWTMRQYAGFSSTAESNQRYRYLLQQGVTGLSVAFDLPTQIGYDSDQPQSLGEVGRVGVPISSLEDMEDLFDEIPLDKISVSMTINSTAPILLCLLTALATKRGLDPATLRGTVQNDILKEYIARGTYRFPVDASMRLVTDVFAWSKKELPEFNTISISGYHIREAGSTALQELAFTLADGIAYVEAALKAGLNVDDFAGQLSFFFNAHNNLFEEVAKFRAARVLWANIMKERFGAKEKKSWQLRFHTQTAGSTLTAQQSSNNISRVTLQALAAVLGGTQSLHTNSKDEALALPSEEAARTALRTQQIIAFESGVTEAVDPLGGSPYIEGLTDKMIEEATELIQKIDDMGGMVKAIKSSWPQSEIRRSAYASQQAIEDGSQKVVGVNCFEDEKDFKPELLKLDASVEGKRKEKLKTLRAKRDNALLEEKLKALEDAARGEENLMPFILEAVTVYATVGEVCTCLQNVFGEYKG